MDWKSTEKKPIVKKPFARIEKLLDDLLKLFAETRKEIKNESVSRV